MRGSNPGSRPARIRKLSPPALICIPQSRQSTGLFSSRPNWDLTRRRLCSLPLWFRGEDTLARGRGGGGGGGSKFGRGDKHFGTLGITALRAVYCTLGKINDSTTASMSAVSRQFSTVYICLNQTCGFVFLYFAAAIVYRDLSDMCVEGNGQAVFLVI
jgi:hypothetical protein